MLPSGTTGSQLVGYHRVPEFGFLAKRRHLCLAAYSLHSQVGSSKAAAKASSVKVFPNPLTPVSFCVYSNPTADTLCFATLDYFI